jgi:hypothetical protein
MHLFYWGKTGKLTNLSNKIHITTDVNCTPEAERTSKDRILARSNGFSVFSRKVIKAEIETSAEWKIAGKRKRKK